MKEVKGTCKFCGQIKMISVPDNCEAPEEEANEIATRECHCFEAKAYQDKLQLLEDRENSIRSAHAMIIELFGEEFGETAQILRAAISPLSNFMFQKLTIKVNDTVNASISINGAGIIKVERLEKKKYTRTTNY